MKCMEAVLIVGTLIIILLALGPAINTLAKDYPDGERITLQGAVEDFSRSRTFVLRGAKGTIKIDLSSAKPMALKEGEKVSVTGNFHHTLLGTDIIATTVTEGVGQDNGNALDARTGQDAASGNHTVNIRSLPTSGLVKVNGVVDNVGNSKNFTLKDLTGQIGVRLMAGEAASLKSGTEVAVVGKVKKGPLGKTINATKIEVVSASDSMVNR